MAIELVSVRDLRNRGGAILDGVERGESVTITRDGRAVASLQPLPKEAITASEFVARARNLPPVDPAAWRADVDSVVDQSL